MGQGCGAEGYGALLWGSTMGLRAMGQGYGAVLWGSALGQGYGAASRYGAVPCYGAERYGAGLWGSLPLWGRAVGQGCGAERYGAVLWG